MPIAALPVPSGKVSLNKPSALIRIVFSRPKVSLACTAMRLPSGSKTGKKMISGLPVAIFVSTGFMSVSPTLMASWAVTVPPSSLKTLANTLCRLSA